MRVTGIDPGYQCTACVCLEGDAFQPELVGHLPIRPHPIPWKELKYKSSTEQAQEFMRIQGYIYQYVTEHLVLNKPNLVVVEWPGWYFRAKGGKSLNTITVIKLHKAVDAISWAILDCRLQMQSIWPDVSNRNWRGVISLKKQAVEKCHQLWPDIKLIIHEADAAMLAWYGLRR